MFVPAVQLFTLLFSMFRCCFFVVILSISLALDGDLFSVEFYLVKRMLNEQIQIVFMEFVQS